MLHLYTYLDSSDIAYRLPTIGARGLFDGQPSITSPRPNGGRTFARVRTVGALYEYSYLSREDELVKNDTDYNSIRRLPSPHFDDGSLIPNGFYRILMRALRVTGDPEKQEDYDSYLSEIVGIWNEAPSSP